MSPLTLKPAVAESLAVWHRMVETKDLSGLAAITHPGVVFRSPAAHTPYPTAPVLALILDTVMKLFQDFTYHREFATGDGLSVGLEFSARIGDKQLKGLDLIRFDESGKIVEFEVMVRPLSALQALAGAMGERLGPYLQAMKK